MAVNTTHQAPKEVFLRVLRADGGLFSTRMIATMATWDCSRSLQELLGIVIDAAENFVCLLDGSKYQGAVGNAEIAETFPLPGRIHFHAIHVCAATLVAVADVYGDYRDDAGGRHWGH